MPTPHLFAAINPEMLFAVFALLVIIIQGIGRLIAAAGNPKPPQRPLGQPAAPMNRAPGGDDRDPLRSEIEEFLKRVSNKRDPQKPAAQPQPAAQRNPASSQRQNQPRQPQTRTAVPQGKRYGAPQPAQRRRQPPVIVATSGASTVDAPEQPRDSIDEHVKKFLSKQQFAKSDQLSSIDEQERQFDKHVQQAFTHDLGQLRPGDLAAASRQQPAGSVGSPFSAANLRSAIVLSEIINRPEHRWT